MFTGVTVNPTPLQALEAIAVMAGVGFKFAVTSNRDVPSHPLTVWLA